jgi:hypothetical protein
MRDYDLRTWQAQLLLLFVFIFYFSYSFGLSLQLIREMVDNIKFNIQLINKLG